VRPSRPADVPAVIAVVTAITRAEPEVTNTTVTAPVSDERLMPAVVRRLDDEGVGVAELTLRGSSLDEVFLSLTGRRPEDAEGSVAA
jgi:oleandomycin transport system ATP-binding protein